MVSLVLSKSGKGVLFYPGDGSVWITSVKYMEMLLEGKLRGNLLVFKMLRGAVDRGLGDLEFGKKRGGSGDGGVLVGSGDVDL